MRIDRDLMIVSGLIGVMSAGFLLGVWLPENRKVTGFQERIAAAEEKLGPNFNQPAALASQREQVDELRDQVDASDRHIPANPELAELLRSLTEAVKAQRIGDQEFQTQANRDHRHYSEVPVELELRGRFEAAYDVLEQIETMPRLIRVDAMNLRLIDDGHAMREPRMHAAFRLSGFYTERQEGGS